MEDKKAYFKVLANGPLEVSGNFELRAASGTVITTEGPLFLCRCGKTADKPFCDGSHRKEGFRD